MQPAILIFIAATNLLIGTYVLVHKPRAIINRSFFIFVFGIALWISGFVLLFTFKNFLFDKLIHYGGLIIAIGLFMFMRVFPAGGALGSRFWFFCLPLLAVAIFVIPFNLLIKTMIVHPNGTLEPVNGPVLPFYIILIGIYAIWSLFILGQRFYRSSGTTRMQIKYFYVGAAIFIVAALFFDGLLPSLGIYNFNLLGPLSSIAFIAFTAYAILKHQLLDIRIVIQRSLIYFLLLGIIAVIYMSGLQLFGYFLNKLTHLSIIIMAGLTMIIGILFFHPLERYFQKITDKIFFKDKYNYPAALHRLSRILNTNLNQADIISSSSLALKEIFKTNQVIFCLSNRSRLTNLQLKDDGSIFVPIIFEGQNLGVLKLGPKLSGSSYDNYDLQLMETFAQQAAMAIEKSKLYEKVKEYSAHLEQLVENRMAEIKKLHEEQKQAMIDISHNLQTPLTIIEGELDLLPDLSQCHEKVQAVKKSINHISVFIRQLLHLAKLEQSSFDITFQPINFSSLIGEQAEYFEVMANEAGIILRATVAPGIFIFGDKQLLQEMLVNLVSNAIKYRRLDARATVSIILIDRGQETELVVADNGLGISAEDLSRIFTRFYSGLTTSSEKGTGLGLAIVKKIVERHQGHISVFSVLGKGATFHLVFPKINPSF